MCDRQLCLTYHQYQIFRTALKTRLPILLLAAPLLSAQEPEAVVKKSPIALLPNGSVLQGVLLPRYDENRRLVGDLKAETMTLIDGDRIQGETVLIRFYNADRTPGGRVELTRALFDQEKSCLYAKQDVVMTRDRLDAKGGGLVYSFESGEGFLLGPVSTRLSPPPPSTSMNTNPFAIPAAALLAFAPTTAPAAPPAFVTPEEIAEMKTQAAKARPAYETAEKSTSASLSAGREAATTASAAATSFMRKNEINTIASDDSREAAPLEVSPGPNDTVINCEGGMYFDNDEGVLVYMKNVTVIDPRFNLSGADELKIFFDKKPAGKEDDPEEAPGLASNIGDVRKLIATGAVRMIQKSVDGKKPVEASGGLLIYDIKSGEMIISERFPWVKQGTFYARAKEANLSLRLLNTGEFNTRGAWEMGAPLDLKGR